VNALPAAPIVRLLKSAFWQVRAAINPEKIIKSLVLWKKDFPGSEKRFVHEDRLIPVQ
jgi:hypothetical protein